MRKEFGESVEELEISFGDVFESSQEGRFVKCVVIDVLGNGLFFAVAFTRGDNSELLVAKIPGTSHLSDIDKAEGDKLSLEEIIEGSKNFVKKHKMKIEKGYIPYLRECSKKPPVLFTK